MVLIAVAIKCDSPGPAIFTQQRLGRRCRLYPMHKFRSLKHGCGEAMTIVVENDARVTRVGHWLRHLRIDELPQLLDILMGRMALVGPRPEVPANLEAIAPEERERLLSVRPGLTGPTQLEFIAEDTLLAETSDPTATYRRIIVPAKVRRDLAWLPTRSLSSDVLVLLRTPMVLLSRRSWTRSRNLVEQILAANRD